MQDRARTEFTGQSIPLLATAGPVLWVAIATTTLSPLLLGQPRWEPLQTTGTPPPKQRGAGGVLERRMETNRLIFYGGEGPGHRFFGDTFYFDLKRFQWTRPALQNPPPRCHHTMIADQAGNRILVFGGFPRNHELWSFDQIQRAWRNITPPSVNPLARCLHAGVIDERRGRMIVFGGLNGPRIPDLEDTWSYDFGAGQWAQIGTAISPGPRYGTVSINDKERDRMILFGGLLRAGNGAFETNDLWALDLGTPQWHRLEPVNDPPSPRQFAGGVLLEGSDRLLVFGGMGPRGPADAQRFKNDLWLLDLKNLVWTQRTIEGERPAGRFRPTMILDDQSGYLYLGFGQGDAFQYFNDLWRLNLKELTSIPEPARLALVSDGSGFALRWEGKETVNLFTGAKAGIPSYQVETSRDLVTWRIEGNAVEHSDGPDPARFRYPLTPGSGARYFRVKTVPEP